MSNEFKLSHGSRERKRQQSITLTAIEIERLASEGAHCSGKGIARLVALFMIGL
jgi:hypothetical protein